MLIWDSWIHFLDKDLFFVAFENPKKIGKHELRTPHHFPLHKYLEQFPLLMLRKLLYPDSGLSENFTARGSSHFLIVVDLETIFKLLGLLNKYFRISSCIHTLSIPFSKKKKISNQESLKWNFSKQNPWISIWIFTRPRSLKESYARLNFSSLQLFLQNMGAEAVWHSAGFMSKDLYWNLGFLSSEVWLLYPQNEDTVAEQAWLIPPW